MTIDGVSSMRLCDRYVLHKTTGLEEKGGQINRGALEVFSPAFWLEETCLFQLDRHIGIL